LKDLRVLAIGAVVVDYIFVTDKLPEKDTKNKADHFVTSIGGPAFTALALVRRHGIEVCFLGNVGDDFAGHTIARYCRDKGIEVADGFVVEGLSTNCASIWVEKPTGSRTVLWAQSEAINSNKIDKFDVSQFALLLCDGHNMQNAIAISRQCRAQKIPVVLDLGSAKAEERFLIANTTHLIASSRYLEQVFGSESALTASSALLEQYPQLEFAAFTLGSRGLQGRCRNRQYEVAAPAVEQPLDTTGAGDVFHGAFACGLLRLKDIQQSLEYAAFCAAHSCCYYGSVGAVEQMKLD
jgi:sulfofructose kinase